MPYIPKSQYSIKYTNGGELYDPLTEQIHVGEYIEYGNKYYAGNNLQNLGNKLKKVKVEESSIVNNSETFLYNQLNPKQYKKLKRRSLPISTKPKPTELDYEKGVMERYFCQKINNDNDIREIDSDGYNKLKGGTYDNFLYNPGKILWSLKDREVNNTNVLKLIRQYPNIQFFFDDPLEYIK